MSTASTKDLASWDREYLVQNPATLHVGLCIRSEQCSMDTLYSARFREVSGLNSFKDI